MPTHRPHLDRDELLALLGEALSASSAQLLRQTVLSGAGTLFESVQIAWTELNTNLSNKQSATTTVAESSDEETELAQMLGMFNKYAWQHPVLALVIATGHASAVSISDLMSREQFTRLDLYTHFFKHLTLEDQLTVGYVANAFATGLSVNRDSWGFTDDERTALTQIGKCVFPYYRLLKQTERNATNALPLIEVTTNTFVTHTDTLGVTLREAELLDEVARGKSNKQICVACGISQGTVRKHLENAFRKLGVSNRVSAITKSVELIRRAIDGGAKSNLH